MNLTRISAAWMSVSIVIALFGAAYGLSHFVSATIFLAVILGFLAGGITILLERELLGPWREGIPEQYQLDDDSL